MLKPVTVLSPARPTSSTGLSEGEAKARLARFGPNVLVPDQHRVPAILRVLKPLADPMAVLLLVAAPTYLLLGDYADAIVSLVALIPIAGVNVLLESRAEKAIEQLKRLTAPTAAVVRDGEVRQVPVAELVPGDVLELREGDVIPADGELVVGLQMMVDESALTGESHPSSKSSVAAPEERLLYAGTNVLSGQGRCLLTETGPRTRFGQIGTLVASIEDDQTPLQKLIHRLVFQFSLAAGVVCVIVAGIQLTYGHSLGDAVIAGVSLAIAAIPEEFPMVFTLYLGLGAWRLARADALVRKLAGVETLGATTVICTDKTGTLTLGQLELAALARGTTTVHAGQPLTLETRALLETTVLACEPQPFDPIEIAIRRFAEAAGAGLPAGAAELVADHAFDPVVKYMSHIWRTNGGAVIAAKGALEGMLDVCQADAETRRTAHALNDGLAGEGMRVLAVARGELPGDVTTREADEVHLQFQGLVAFRDPVRPGVLEALAECRDAGVRVVMITGDHPLTARAVARNLGLPDSEEMVITGPELEALDEAGRIERLERTAIFARAMPEQKYEVVRALREAGETVAMTGDGINDAPALREADIGIAMGRRGTQVAREAATLVLLDDNFATIVHAIRDGRRIFENLRRAMTYLIGFHIPLLFAAVLVPLLGQPLLLLPIHLVVLELIVHPTVSLVFESDPAPADLMRRPPRKRSEGILRRRDAMRPLLTGLTLSFASVAVYLGELARDVPEDRARAIGFATMVIGQTLMVLVERSPEMPLWRAQYRGALVLGIIVVGTIATVVAATAVPGLSALMKLEFPRPSEWLVIVAAAAVSTLWFEPLKRRVGRTAERSGIPQPSAA